MASTASNASPQANLKDRIAALQRLNHQNVTPQTLATTTASPSRATLRDKIAKFEKRGGIPIPRGSFGMGIPPPDDGASKKKGEFYGNRVLGLNRPTGPPSSFVMPRSITPSPSVDSPSHRKRSLSASGLDFELVKPGVESNSGIVSPTVVTAVRDGIDVGEATASSDSPMDAQRSAISSPRRNTIVFGRRTRSDSDDAFKPLNSVTSDLENFQSQQSSESQTVQTVKDVVTADKEGSFEAELTDSSKQEISVIEGQPPDSASAKKISSGRLVIRNVSGEASPFIQAQEPGRSSTTLTPPVVRSDAKTSLSATDIPQSLANSLSSEGTNPAKLIAADTTEPLLPTDNTAVALQAASAPSPSPVPSLPSEPTTPMSTIPLSPSEPQPIEDSQLKLRKKPYPNSSPAFQEPSLTPKSGRKSFTAVVHKKTDEPVSSTTKLDGVDNVAVTPATPARVQKLAREKSLAPASPTTNELVLLAAEAALLESQLGTFESLKEDSADSVPLFARPRSIHLSSFSPVPELVQDDTGSGQTDHMSFYSVPTVREVGEMGETLTSPTLSKTSRSRKLSNKIRSLASAGSSTLRSIASSNYSRPSISSELSDRESMRGPSVPSTPREDNSIGGSSGSSFKWSSPKRNPLSRATSFADKLLNRSTKARSLLDDSSDNLHLSPSRASIMSKGSYEKSRSLSSRPPAPRLDLPDFSYSPTLSTPSLSAVSSPSSGHLFDPDLFDAFPSVPAGLPQVSHYASTSTLSHSGADTNRSSSQTIRNL